MSNVSASFNGGVYSPEPRIIPAGALLQVLHTGEIAPSLLPARAMFFTQPSLYQSDQYLFLR